MSSEVEVGWAMVKWRGWREVVSTGWVAMTGGAGGDRIDMSLLGEIVRALPAL